MNEREIFLGALEQSIPGARAAYLDRACASNPVLRSRIEALLVEHGKKDDFLEGSPERGPGFGAILSEAAKNAPFLAPTEKAGDRIGCYRLIKELGAGGWGVVYMAEQDQPVHRCVALKVIKLGMDTGQVIARFEAERQALAMMDHPNIAKVFDAGATDTGRPYFVMELIAGTKITDYCDENQLSTRERLELFVHVCQAVQHAHHKGIIHRDLKPSNILVSTHDGVAVPKIIDFGVAKATRQPLTEKTIVTAFGQFIGTLGYMSPEQMSPTGGDIDTRSDIYSLGVVLYELLTGKTPFDTSELLAASFGELCRTIREEQPERPSTRLGKLEKCNLTTTAERRQTQPPRLINMVRGDLDWIVMTALEKDRKRRYKTSSELARDVQRYLRSEPVAARPTNKLYQFQKLVRRNLSTLLFAAARAVAAILIIGVVVGVMSQKWSKSHQIPVPSSSYGVLAVNTETPGAQVSITPIVDDKDDTAHTETKTAAADGHLEIQLKEGLYSLRAAWESPYGEHLSSQPVAVHIRPNEVSTESLVVPLSTASVESWVMRHDSSTLASTNIALVAESTPNEQSQPRHPSKGYPQRQRADDVRDDLHSGRFLTAEAHGGNKERLGNAVKTNAVVLGVTNEQTRLDAGVLDEPVIVDTQELQGGTSLSLTAGCQLYVYAVQTGGALPTTAFNDGQTIEIYNMVGNVGAEIVATTNNSNGYRTQALYHTIGGFGISGFRYACGFYGSRMGSNPTPAVVTVRLSAPALVAVTASATVVVTVSGADSLVTDVPSPNQGGAVGMTIEHAYLNPGTYTIQELSSNGDQLQDPDNQVDLLGVFVFSDYPQAASSISPRIPLPIPGQRRPAAASGLDR